jgi:chromosome segregation ATPase
MFTGRDALFSIERAISRLRADEGRLDAALRSAMDEAARLRREEAEGFRALARVRLDAMLRDQVIGELDATERQALALIEEHRRALETLARQREEAQARLDKAEAEKHENDQKLADALEALEALRRRAAERVKTQPAWQEAKAAVEAAEEIAGNAERKVAQAEADLAEKRRPYEADPLFMYLWNKKHGEAEDRSGSFVRYVDRKVARLIGYHDARVNYAMLQEIPKRLREHAERKKADVDAAKARLAAIERDALAAEGVEPLEAQAASAHAAVQAGESEIAKLTAELRRIEAERRQLIEAGDQGSYGRAVELLAQALAREDLRELYEQARRTPTKADDKAIASITAARAAREKADAEVAQIRSEIREMARRRSELEGARDRARRSGYDDPRGTFQVGADVIGAVIGGILGGVLQGMELDRVLRDNYRRPRGSVDPDFGYRGGLPPWFDPWGGRRGGDESPGPWEGRGDRDGDGWRTGGRF